MDDTAATTPAVLPPISEPDPKEGSATGFAEGIYAKTGKRYVVRLSAVVGELWPRGRGR